MGIGGALWWGSLEGADLATLVASASAAGFAEVSATPAMYVAARDAGYTDAALFRMLDDHGVAVSVIDPLLRGLPGACAADRVGRRWRATFEHDEDDCHRAADALGATVINVAHFLGAPTTLEELVESIGAIAERAGRRGRAVAVEAMPEGSIPDLSAATAIVRGVGAATCGLTVDTWHWWRSGGSDEEIAALGPDEVLVLQVSDALTDVRGSATSPPVRDRLLPGAGELPLADLLRRVRATSPEVRVGLEVFDAAVSGRSCAERSRIAHEALRALEADTAALG